MKYGKGTDNPEQEDGDRKDHQEAKGEGATAKSTRREKGEGEMEDTTDNLKAVSVKLPTLAPHTGKESGIACGDWLVEVRPLIGDMTSGALQWWDDLVNAVTVQYNKWLLADPLARLQLLPPSKEGYNTTSSRRRMDLRASTLLLGALPESLKSELVAARQMTSGVYRIMRNYTNLED